MPKYLTAKLEKMRDIGPRICLGCLSLDRVLYSITEYDELHQIIIDNSLFNKKIAVLLCWECVAVLKKMKLFKEQVRNAANILLLQKKHVLITEPKSLSKLSKYTIEEDTIEHKIEDEKNCIDIPFDTFNVSDNPVSELNQTADTSHYVSNIIGEAKIGSEDITSAKVEVKEEVEDDDFFDHDFEDLLPVKEEDIKQEVKKQKITRKQQLTRHEKYTWVKEYKKELICKTKIDPSDVGKYIEIEKTCKFYLKAKNKCDKCLMTFRSEELLKEHIELTHIATARYNCLHCHSGFSTDTALQEHMQSHLICYRCKACIFESYTKTSINKHLKYHQGCIKCNICGHFNRNVRVFYNHYKKYHTEFICDTCGAKRSNKEGLMRHIKTRHAEVKCTICGIRLSQYRRLHAHMKRVHTVNRNEAAFCVACNKQFDNEIKYYDHFNMVHRKVAKKEMKCPDCDKVYTRRNYLNNHYRMEHEKKTKHYCVECDKYFLNNWRYKQHTWYTHEGRVRPKHILCNLCGRGFSSNAILIKHIRTHTGERPYKCTMCEAAFTQKSALDTHTRCVHKLHKKPAQLQTDQFE